MRLRNVVGVGLLAFMFVFVSVLLFGFAAGSTLIFTLGFLALTLFITGTIYVMEKGVLEGAVQHAVIIIVILLVSSGFAAAAGNVKEGYLTSKDVSETQAQLTREVQDLEAMTIAYLDAATQTQAQIAQVQQQNGVLMERVATLKNENVAAQERRYQEELQTAQDALAEQQQQIAEQAAQVQDAADKLAQQQAAVELAAQQAAALQAAAEQAAQAAAQEYEVDDD